MTTITALPSPPSRQDPTNFNDRADAFLGALPAFATEANAVASETNTASANAVAANQAVIAATNITKWVSGTTYANGAVVWSPINGLAYRRITASGSGTTDPSLDTTNYKQVNGTGDVSTSGNQTIAGVKTFSTPIAVGSGGTGANTAAAAFDNIKQSATDTYTGVVEIATDAEAIAGTDTNRVITPASMIAAKIVSSTAVAVAGGSSIDFTGILSWAKRVTVMFSGVSTNGSSALLVQLGTSSGVQNTGYLSASTAVATSAATTNYTTGFGVDHGAGTTSSAVRHGVVTLSKIDGNIWTASGFIGLSNGTYTCSLGGSKSLSGTLDRIRITTVNGTDAFDAGTINILWE